MVILMMMTLLTRGLLARLRWVSAWELVRLDRGSLDSWEEKPDQRHLFEKPQINWGLFLGTPELNWEYEIYKELRAAAQASG